MMNKRRTKEIGRTKYLMFIPLAALLMIVSNIEMVARTTEKFAKKMMGQETEQVALQPEVANVSVPVAAEIQPIAPPQDKKVKVVPESKSVPDSVVFEVVEQMPEFPGGVKGLYEYLGKNIKYPAEAHAAGTQGRVIVSFIVRKDGSISDIKIVRSVDSYLDKEAERVIAAMPKWKPGMQRGQAVNVKFTVPVMFRLSGPEQPKAEEIKETELSELIVVGYAPKEEALSGSVEKNPKQPLKVAEVMPKFPGGVDALFRYLARSIKYPVIAQEKKEQGKVTLQMVIGKDGKVSDIKIIDSVSPSLAAEAIRVVSTMPKWEPGLQGGQPVAVEYTLPVVFRLQ